MVQLGVQFPYMRRTYVQPAAIIRYIMHNACMYRRDDEKCSFVAKMSRPWQIIPCGAAASHLLRDNVHEITRTQVFRREIRGETVTLSRPRYIVFINIYKSISRADEHRGTWFHPSGIIDISRTATSGRCADKAGQDSKGWDWGGQGVVNSPAGLIPRLARWSSCVPRLFESAQLLPSRHRAPYHHATISLPPPSLSGRIFRGQSRTVPVILSSGRASSILLSSQQLQRLARGYPAREADTSGARAIRLREILELSKADRTTSGRPCCAVIAITNYKGRQGEAVKFRLSPARCRDIEGGKEVLSRLLRRISRDCCDFIHSRMKCARYLIYQGFPFENSSSFFSLIGNINWCVPDADDWLDLRGLFNVVLTILFNGMLETPMHAVRASI